LLDTPCYPVALPFSYPSLVYLYLEKYLLISFHILFSDRRMSGEDRPVVGEPLHGLRRARRAKSLLDAVDHHVADHLTGDAGRRGDPTDDLAVVAIEGEGEAHHLAVPASELQAIRAPADI